jgi:DUF4097 and DUF4098 domain-containing protein YvlB
MMRTLWISAVLMGAAWPAPAQQSSSTSSSRRDQDYESRIDTTFAFDRRGTVSLTISGGEIIVTAWNQDRVRVRARSERSTIRMDATSARLALELTRARGGDTRFEVTVPVGVRIVARATTGDVSVSGTKGSVDAGTQSGDLTVEDVAEMIYLRTMSGEIVARGLSGNVEIGSLNGDLAVSDMRGDLEAATVSGDIDMRGIAARYIRAKSTSGDLSYDGVVDPAGRYEFGSHSGGVYLTIPPATGALLTLGTYSGSIDSDFPITLKPGAHTGTRRFTFEVGKGDARINAESFSGDITIRLKGRSPSDR